MDENRKYAKKLSQVLSQMDIDEFQENFIRVQKLMSYYRCALLEVETKFKVLNEQFSFEHERNPIDSIKSRLKSPESIQKKLKKMSAPYSISSIEENLHDVAGLRVICPFVDDIYLLADCLINQDDITLVEMKDYIKNPKPNGYRSLHLIIEVPIFLQDKKRNMKVEVQLRTIAMESWANLEHRLRYKKNLNEDIENKVSHALNECAAMCASLDEKMQEVRDIITE